MCWAYVAERSCSGVGSRLRASAVSESFHPAGAGVLFFSLLSAVVVAVCLNV